AYATKAKITIDGKAVSLEVYTIDDYTYFKLRDVASAVNGTSKQFDTVWDEENSSINLVTNTKYSGTAAAKGVAKDTIAATSKAKLYLNGERESVRTFTINDYTYYKLRDIGELLDFGVTWNEATFTVGIDTSKGF
ncbi:MAG: hypothetical protein ACK5I7_00005, partial [Anaerotignum sp.]